jgi:alkanesulfonate monooxygenase SsuD/methylene tetrahydromethanopterin reductase-like flavin-dependent oxidoreductase (luciferase family)
MPILIGGERPRMLGLAARYADLWNTSWYGQPPPLQERRHQLDTACVAEGRQAGAVATTVGVTLLPPGHSSEHSDATQALFGAPEAVAEGLLAYAELGIGHVICRMNPCTPATLTWFDQVLQHARMI